MAGRPWERYKPQQPAGKPWERYAPKPDPAVDLGPLPSLSGGADASAAVQPSLDVRQDQFNESTTFGERLGNNIRRGVQGFRTAVQSGLAGERMQTAADLEDDGATTVGGIPFAPDRPQEVADQIRQKAAQNITAAIESQRKASQIPQSPAVAAFTGAQSFDEGLSALATDPFGVIGAVGVESTVQFLPALAVMAATRSPGAAVLAGGLNSAGLEYGGSLLEYLGKNGVDTSNAQAVQAALSDPEIAKAANEFAKTRAGIIASADAATAGLASRVPVLRPFTSRFANEALNAGLVQPAVQGVAGGGAEAAAQLATEGEITAPGQILAETAGEFFGAPLEVAPAAIDRARRIRTGDPDMDVGVDEAQTALERARARIRTQVTEYLDRAAPEAPTVPNVSTTVPNAGTSRLEQRRAEIAAREAQQAEPVSAPDDLDALLGQRFGQGGIEGVAARQGMTVPEFEAEVARTDDRVPQPAGEEGRFTVGPSQIAGRGVMATEASRDGLTVLDRGNRTDVGRYVNHSDTPNTRLEVRGDQVVAIPDESVQPGDELTIDYNAAQEAGQVSLRGLEEEIGWAERGGRLLRDQSGVATSGMEDAEAAARNASGAGEVIGRTQWQPKSDFWPTYRGTDPNPLNEDQARAALAKVDAGETLTKREQRFVDYARQYAQRQEAERNTDPAPPADPAMDRATERFQRGQISEEEMAAIRAGQVAPEDAIPFSRRRPQQPAQDDMRPDAAGGQAPSPDGLEAREGDEEAIRAMQEMERRRIEEMPADQFAAMAMQVLGRIPEVFRTQLVPGRTVRETAEASGLTVAGFQNVGGRKVTEVRADQREGGPATAFIVEDGDNVYLNVADLTAGGGAGERVYNAAFSYARNTGKNFVEDPEGLSDRALYRRPVQQTAMMMKAGSAENIGPGPYLSQPPAAGPGTRPIRYDSRRKLTPTLAEHLRTVYANTVRAIPEARNVGYDFQRDAYFERGPDGRPVRDLSDSDLNRLVASRRANPVGEAMVRDGLTGEDGRSPAPVGRNTVKVAAIADSLLRASGAERTAILGELGSLASRGPRDFPRGLDRILPSRRGGGKAKSAADFETGRPVTFEYLRNVAGVRQFDTGEYGTDLEPVGRYMLFNESGRIPESDGRPGRSRWQAGIVSFENPLVVDSANWKRNLSERFGGAKGQALTDAIRAAGHDGVVTKDRYGVGEIVDLTGTDQARYSRRNAEQRRNLKTINVEVTTSDGETVTARADVVLRAAEKRLNALAMLADCIRR